MRQTRIRLAVAVGLLPFAGLFSVGCDTETGREDKAVSAILLEGDLKKDPEARLKDIERAGQNSASSAPTQVHVKSLLGDEVLAKARVDHATADGHAAAITGLLLSLDRMAADVANATNGVGVLKAYEPVQPKSSVATKLKELNEGDNGAWIAPLQALSAVKATSAELTTKISETESKVKQLTEQRAAALAEADSLQMQSEAAKGKESVDLYKQSSAKRKEAMDLAAQVDVTATSLIPLRQDLAVAQGQEAQRAGAIAGFEQTGATIDTGWQGVQTASATIAAGAKGIVEGDKAGPGTIVETARQLADAFDEYESKVTTATANYDTAVNHYSLASGAAKKATSELATLITERDGKSEVEAFKAMQVTLSPFPIDLKKGTAQQGLAMLQARQATLLAARERVMARVVAALTAAGATAPAGVTTEGASDAAKAAAATAVATFEATVATLDPVAQGGSTTGARNAKGNGAVALMLTQYAWSQFATALGDTAAAASHLQAAKDARSLATDDGKTILPPLPAELALPPAPVVPPAGAPAVAPVAAPAGATPEGAPAGPAPQR